MSPSSDQLLSELQRLAADLERAPMPDEIEEQSAYTTADYRAAFGSWAHALDAADLELPTGRRIPDESLLAELRRLAAEVEKTPSEQEMTAQGHHGVETYKNRFGSWSEAVEEAGLTPRPDRTERSREALLAELQRIADELGRSPSSREAEARGESVRTTYRDEFGSWNDALTAAGLDPRDPPEKVPREELLAELHRLADEKGGKPTTTDMKRDGAFSPGTYISRFGSWTDALAAADLVSESS